MALDRHSPEYQAFIAFIRNGHLEEVEQHLGTHPEFLNLLDTDGYTSLHYAAKYGHDSVQSRIVASTRQHFHGWTPYRARMGRGQCGQSFIL